VRKKWHPEEKLAILYFVIAAPASYLSVSFYHVLDWLDFFFRNCQVTAIEKEEGLIKFSS